MAMARLRSMIPSMVSTEVRGLLHGLVGTHGASESYGVLPVLPGYYLHLA
jgi:hypothetical protein